MTPVPGPNVGLNAAVAAELRAERAAQRVTLQELADESSVPLMSVRRYLNADRHIDIATLNALAIALGTTAVEVVESAQVRMAREAADALSEELPNLRSVADKSDIEGAGENSI